MSYLAFLYITLSYMGDSSSHQDRGLTRHTHPALPWQVHPSSSLLEEHANRRHRLCLRWCLPTRTGSGGSLEQQEGSWAKHHLWYPLITTFHQLYTSSLYYILNIFILEMTCQRNYRFFAFLFPVHIHQQPWQRTWQIKGTECSFYQTLQLLHPLSTYLYRIWADWTHA